MNNKENNNRVPELRFPGFTGDWEAPTISEIFDIRNGYTPSKRIPEYWEGGTIPWFRMEDIRENGGILADAIQHISPLGVKGKGLFKKNSIILATTATIGIHAMLIADSLANQQFTNFSIRESLSHLYSPMYIYYAFFGIDEWCKKNTNAGGLLSVNMPALLKQPFPTPTLAEQQKIADFLSSLDELIAAEAQKADALKDHKKGLMQQLFPAISNEQLAMSNCVPKLRFPGFTGEWEVKKLGEIADSIVVGFPFKGEDLTNDKTGVLILRGLSIGEGFIKHGGDYDKYYTGNTDSLTKYVLHQDDVVMGMDGSIGRNIALVTEKEDNSLLIQRVARIRISKYPLHMIYQQIMSQRFKDYVGSEKVGAVIAHISQKQIENFPIYAPQLKSEQQKIADCLSELDEMISAQQQKVEALKEHKKGLMQKLFPKMSN